MAIDINILGNDSSFTNLTLTEKKILKKALEMEIERRKKAGKAKQIREIVPIHRWLESEYYLGPNHVRIYDYWKELIAEVYDPKRKPEERINEVIISGSIGIGKSTCATILLLRKIYELSCYENITALFNLMSTSSIVFLYFSVNKNQAELTGFGDMKALIDSIPYFKEEFPRNDKIDSLILFPENLMMTYGSGTQHAIGMNVLGSILDEANFFQGESKEVSLGGNSKISKVAELYSSIVNRSKSRFVSDGGIDHSLNILVSSATHESSFTEQRIKASEGDPHTIVRCPTLWEVKPKAYSKKFFYVFKGNNTLDPYIINSIDDLNQYRLSEGMKKIEVERDKEKDLKVIEEEIKKLPEIKQKDFLGVPIELKKGFETNLLQSLQDFGGVSVAPTGRLFTSKPVFNDCCYDYLYHPFISTSIVISTGDDIKIQDYLRPGFRFRDKNKPRYIHIDQSTTTDCTGISCVYIESFIEEDGIKKPVICVDFMLQILPPKPPKKIALYKIRDFIIYLRDVYGLKIGKVTYDMFNSEESRQILQELKFNVGYQSVDKNDSAYVDAVTLLYERRIKMYYYEPLRDELFHLIHDRKRRKVDHPRRRGDGRPGSKDVADSFVGAIHNALESGYGDNVVYNSLNDFRKANPISYGYENYFVSNNDDSSGDVIDKIIDREIDMMLEELDF